MNRAWNDMNNMNSMNLSNKNLKSLPTDLPEEVGHFDCDYNELTDLVGAPIHVDGYFSCKNNRLTSLFGAPKNDLYMRLNIKLLDISDIWYSDIGDRIYLGLNKGMAILPLIKFKSLQCDNSMITSIHERHRGLSKQNIMDFQYELIEHGFDGYAKWKPEM